MTTDSNGRGLYLKTPRDGEERGPTEQAEPAATERLRGKVKTVVEVRGYGFIKAGDRDYFVHAMDTQVEDFTSALLDVAVEFTPAPPLREGKHPRATDVKVVEEGWYEFRNLEPDQAAAATEAGGAGPGQPTEAGPVPRLPREA